MKKNGIKVLGIFLVALVMVSMFSGCIGEDKENSEKSIELSGYLFILDTNKTEALLTRSYNIEERNFSKEFNKVIYKSQIKEITSSDDILPEKKSIISIDDARKKAEETLKERPPDWIDPCEKLQFRQGFLIYLPSGSFSYTFPIVKENQNNILAEICIDPFDGHCMSISRYSETWSISWIEKNEAIEIFTNITRIDKSNIKDVFFVFYEIEDFKAVKKYLGGEKYE